MKDTDVLVKFKFAPANEICGLPSDRTWGYGFSIYNDKLYLPIVFVGGGNQVCDYADVLDLNTGQASQINFGDATSRLNCCAYNGKIYFIGAPTIDILDCSTNIVENVSIPPIAASYITEHEDVLYICRRTHPETSAHLMGFDPATKMVTRTITDPILTAHPNLRGVIGYGNEIYILTESNMVSPYTAVVYSMNIDTGAINFVADTSLEMALDITKINGRLYVSGRGTQVCEIDVRNTSNYTTRMIPFTGDSDDRYIAAHGDNIYLCRDNEHDDVIVIRVQDYGTPVNHQMQSAILPAKSYRFTIEPYKCGVYMVRDYLHSQCVDVIDASCYGDCGCIGNDGSYIIRYPQPPECEQYYKWVDGDVYGIVNLSLILLEPGNYKFAEQEFPLTYILSSYIDATLDCKNNTNIICINSPIDIMNLNANVYTDDIKQTMVVMNITGMRDSEIYFTIDGDNNNLTRYAVDLIRGDMENVKITTEAKGVAKYTYLVRSGTDSIGSSQITLKNVTLRSINGRNGLGAFTIAGELIDCDFKDVMISTFGSRYGSYPGSNLYIRSGKYEHSSRPLLSASMSSSQSYLYITGGEFKHTAEFPNTSRGMFEDMSGLRALKDCKIESTKLVNYTAPGTGNIIPFEVFDNVIIELTEQNSLDYYFKMDWTIMKNCEIKLQYAGSQLYWISNSSTMTINDMPTSGKFMVISGHEVYTVGANANIITALGTPEYISNFTYEFGGVLETRKAQKFTYQNAEYYRVYTNSY